MSRLSPVLPLCPMQPERHQPVRAPAAPAPRRARRRLLAVLASAVVALALAAPAPAASGSKHLSPQGWSTYRAYELLGTADVDLAHPTRAHAQLRRLIARCSRLPGRGTQSTGVRTICRHAVRLLDHYVQAKRCGDAAGGGDTAFGLCLISALPAMDGDFGAGARASGTVSATLAPGRCRRAFATQALTWAAASFTGDALLQSMDSGDAQGVDAAANRWGDAFEKALDAPVGQGDAGCRPRS
jgi:hypothetical protein